MTSHNLPLTALAISLATSAAADVIHMDDVLVQGDLCVGTPCADDEVFGSALNDQIKVKGIGVGIVLEDTGGTSTNDWALKANAPNEDSFFIEDLTGGTAPFKVLGAAPSNSLFVAADGNVGVGTSLPNANVHVVRSTLANLRLEATSGGPAIWEMSSSIFGLSIQDVQSGFIPFSLKPGAPTNALTVDASGQVGLGLFEPEGKLHTKGDGVQLAYFESGDGGPVQVRFRTDSQNRRFLAVNNANEVKSQIIFKDNEIQFTGATDSGANRWLTIGPAGIVSQGPTCNPGPCDRTFDRDFFTVPPIEDRAAQMWENQHLPGIGPTQPYAPINLTEKMGGVIHELEVAHIYIEELHKQNTKQNAELAAMVRENAALTDEVADMAERLAALERLLAE